MFRDFLRAEKLFRLVEWVLCRGLEIVVGNINLTKE